MRLIRKNLGKALLVFGMLFTLAVSFNEAEANYPELEQRLQYYEGDWGDECFQDPQNCWY